MNNPKLIQDEVTGTLKIAENSQYNNVCVNDVLVESNIIARLYGKVHNVTLKEGSVLNIHGKMTGTVQNINGTLRIFED